MFNALIEVNNNDVEIKSNINIDKKTFEEKIKNVDCGKVRIDNEDYWVLKEGNSYLVSKLESLDRYIDKYKKEAIYDSLTGIFNRAETERRLKELIDKNQSFSLMMLDIDFFKKINDTYGHQGGDYALKKFVEGVKKFLREGDIFGRVGGEEFVIILPNTKIVEALKIAQKIRKYFENNSFEYHSTPIHFTVSIGVTSYKKGDDIIEVIKRADDALYEAKRRGRNRVEYR